MCIHNAFDYLSKDYLCFLTAVGSEIPPRHGLIEVLAFNKFHLQVHIFVLKEVSIHFRNVLIIQALCSRYFTLYELWVHTFGINALQKGGSILE